MYTGVFLPSRGKGFPSSHFPDENRQGLLAQYSQQRQQQHHFFPRPSPFADGGGPLRCQPAKEGELLFGSTITIPWEKLLFNYFTKMDADVYLRRREGPLPPLPPLPVDGRSAAAGGGAGGGGGGSGGGGRTPCAHGRGPQAWMGI